MGNRISMTEGGKTTTYTYNGLNQLTSKTDGTTTTTYAYDGRGNQIQEKTGTTETNFTYGVTGEMLTVANGSAVIQQNEYNHEGIRIARTEGSTERTYLYDNGSVAYTLDNGSVSSANVLGGYQNVVGTYRGSSYYVYNKDIQGSTDSITDGSFNAKAAYEYSDFGEVTELTETIDNEICYTGSIQDETTGLHYMNARYYDPANGRFISQDSYRGEVNDPGQWHLYAYCANNPINYTDPSGHLRVANWLAASILDAGLSLLVGVAAPGLSPVKSILNKLMKCSKTKKALKKFYKDNKDRFLNGFIQMIDFTKSKKYLNKVVEKAKEWFSKKKAPKWREGLTTLADSIGTGYVDDFFWNLSVGKTAFGGLAAGFSFGSLIVSAIDFYQHDKSFEDHIKIGKRKCNC